MSGASGEDGGVLGQGSGWGFPDTGVCNVCLFIYSFIFKYEKKWCIGHVNIPETTKVLLLKRPAVHK